MIVIDMDMPKSCEKCKFFDGEDMCYVDGTYALNPSRISVRSSWCPIKCDIDDIKTEIKAEMRDYDGEEDEFSMGIRCGLRKTNGFIDKHIEGENK